MATPKTNRQVLTAKAHQLLVATCRNRCTQLCVAERIRKATQKISIALEEFGLDYEVIPVDINKDEQFAPDFLAISPNNKIPAIVDGEVSLFESGAILLYLAHKTGKLAPPAGSPLYFRMMQWLMWQVAHFGPMLGQVHHFLKFNPGKSAYAEQRYYQEALRLYRVLNDRLAGRDYIAGEFSIADIATWPWASRFEFQQIDLDDFPNVERWYTTFPA